MSAAVESRAEILMLARLLGNESQELAYLEKLDPEDLRALRRAATDHLFDSDLDGLSRIAAASRLLPPQLSAMIGEKAFGPLLCARIAGLLEPRRATEMAARLSPGFLADVAVELDPRRVSEVVRRMPTEQVVAVAVELAGRDELVTMGRFVGHLEDRTLVACLEAIPDRKLLPIAFVIEDKSRLDAVIGALSDDRAVAVARFASADGHWPEALELAEHISAEQTARLAAAVANGGDEVIAALIDVAGRQRLWDQLLPFTAAMDAETRVRFAAHPAMHRRATLEAIVAATVRNELWAELLPLVPDLPDEAERTLLELAAALPPERIERLRAEAEAAGLGDRLAGLGP